MPMGESALTVSTTLDTFFHGRVLLRQKVRGYRFSVDAPILADFLPADPLARVLEIGTGSGVIAILALYLKKFSRVTAVEVQPDMCVLAAENAGLNGLGQKLTVVCADFTSLGRGPGFFDLIFANPPFKRLGNGRMSANPEIRDCRFETRINLNTLLTQAGRFLLPRGRLCLVFPCERYEELLENAQNTGFFVKKSRMIMPFKNSKPNRFLVQLVTYQTDTFLCEPLVEFSGPGVYSEEMELILAGRKK